MNTSRSFDKHRCVRAERVARMACVEPGRPRPRPPPARAGRGPVYGDSTLRPPPGPEGKCATRDGQRHAPRARTDEGTRAPRVRAGTGCGPAPPTARAPQPLKPRDCGLSSVVCSANVPVLMVVC